MKIRQNKSIYPTPLLTGECWKTVFGELPALELSDGFRGLDSFGRKELLYFQTALEMPIQLGSTLAAGIVPMVSEIHMPGLGANWPSRLKLAGQPFHLLKQFSEDTEAPTCRKNGRWLGLGMGPHPAR
jgi:hypothetical protein